MVAGASLATGSGSAARGEPAPIRILVVDDSLVVRTVLSRVIEPEADMEVVARVASGELALAELARHPADVVLLDLEMPGMGGLEALPRILALPERPAVLVVSTLTEEGAEHTLAALAMGAADTMLKPRSGQFDRAYRQSLLDRIRALASARRAGPVAPVPRPARRLPALALRAGVQPEVVAIGASTGGIHALAVLLRHLSPLARQPILVVQHLPASFAAVFARQLQLNSGRPTMVASEGMTLTPGHIYVAGGEAHLVVRRSGQTVTLASEHGRAPSGCTPSVDPLLSSLARTFGGRALAVVLSGMGRDGALGAAELAARGGRILVQDQASSAVWGMPRAIADAGLADAVLPPDQLAARIALYCGAGA